MVRTEVIRKRLNKLDDYLVILRALQRYSWEEFIDDPEHYGSAERFLQLAIETLADMGSHVISDRGMGVVNQHGDIPAIFVKNGYVDPNLGEEWVRMIGFRNVLVHDYLDIDRSIVYDVLQDRLSTFEALRGVFAQFL
jgi:uncharacterized protein YutE (UPF0331/DUF86 family)